MKQWNEYLLSANCDIPDVPDQEPVPATHSPGRD